MSRYAGSPNYHSASTTEYGSSSSGSGYYSGYPTYDYEYEYPNADAETYPGYYPPEDNASSYYTNQFDDAPISPSSSASCSSASSSASESPLTPAYHAPALPGLLYTRLDSPMVAREEQGMISWAYDKPGADWEQVYYAEEGDMTLQYDGGVVPGTHVYDPATILASPPSYPSQQQQRPLACLSPAQTQLLEIKQPQPKPIIPVISLTALASEAEARRPQPQPQVFSRPVLSLSCAPNPNPSPPQLDAMDVQSPTTYASAAHSSRTFSFQSASTAMMFAPPQSQTLPPCRCADCLPYAYAYVL